jgi:integrase
MATRPKPAKIYEVKTRVDPKSGQKRDIVRWRVFGRAGTPPMRSFTEDKKEKETEFLQDLNQAINDRERFDMVSGLPISMLPEDDVTIAQWCKIFVDREASEYVPASRVHLGDNFTVLIARSAPENAKPLTKEQLREIKEWLASKGELSSEVSRWLARWSPRLRDLRRQDLARILERVSLKEDMVTRLAPSSRSNRLSHTRQVLNNAVAKGRVGELDWPPTKKGAPRKSDRGPDKRRQKVVSVQGLEKLVACSLNRDRRSVKHYLATAITGYAGLRPSEVYGLEVADLYLPGSGWGSIRVEQSRVEQSVRWKLNRDQAFDRPKTSNSVRCVPIPPILVAILVQWLEREALSEGRLFGDGVGFSHWPESLANASKKAGLTHQSPYSLRRAYASHLSAQGVPVASIAERMGNNVKTLSEHYILPIDGFDAAINASLDEIYAVPSGLGGIEDERAS